ncbi:MAG: hypothetical protein ABIP45_05330 [Knoellia sp.]
MATSSGNPRPRHANSPFHAPPEQVAEVYVTGDRVVHDSYGVGRVVSVDAGGLTVDFTDQTLRVTTPCRKMTKF